MTKIILIKYISDRLPKIY